MSYFELIVETKDIKAFQSEFFTLVNSDAKYKTLLASYRKNSDKMVDLVDYTIGKYKTELEKLMKTYSVTYDEVIEFILGEK